jgi:hypothetical protein
MKIGDSIKDNDPRMYGGKRVLTIIEIDETHVTAQQNALRPVRIRKDRIYTDGKARKTGFSLIKGGKS